MRKVIICLSAALAFACSSCGNKDRVYPVSGKVTYKGFPASGAVVYLRRQGGDATKEPTIMGVVKQNGTFELVSGPLGKGGPAGAYDVLVEWTRFTGQGNKRPQTGPDFLKGSYDDPKRPLLHATVKAPSTILPPIELTEAATVQANLAVEGAANRPRVVIGLAIRWLAAASTAYRRAIGLRSNAVRNMARSVRRVGGRRLDALTPRPAGSPSRQPRPHSSEFHRPAASRPTGR